jgi:DNA-binding NarL/FixJ family response regulator
MTTGFEYLKDSLFRSLGRSQMLHIPVDEDLVHMLREFAKEQETSLEAMAAGLLAQAAMDHYRATNEYVQCWEILSQRQQEVAALACLGYSNAEIAEKLHISLETVKTHMGETLRKFNVKGRHQLGWMLRDWDFSPFDEGTSG